MSYQPHLHKGGELYHYRTKGSKNGVSNTPGYRAVGKKALGFLNSAGQYVYNNASKAAGAAGNWMRDRGRDVSKAATNAYNSAKESVTGSNAKKTYQNKKTLVDNTSYYNRNGGTVHMDQVRGQKRTQQEQAKLAKQQYDRSLFGRAENAGKAISKVAGSAGNWLNNRGEDIAKAAKNAKKNASSLASNVSESAKKAASDIRDWATSGGDHQNNARIERAKAKKEREYGNYLEGASAKFLNEEGISGKEAREVAQASADRARVYDKKARDEQDKYNKSLAGKMNEAKGVLSGYTKNTRDLIRENGDKWLKDGKPKNIIDRFTGNSYKKSSDSRKSILNDVDNYLKPESRKFWKGISGVKEANYLDNEYGAMRKQVKALDEQYENAPRQKISKAVDSAANTVKKAGNAISKTASDAKKTASKAISKVGENAKDFIERGREVIGNAWDGSAGKGTAKDNANYARELAKKWPASTHHGQRSQLFSNAAEQDAAYNKSIVGRAENLGKNISKTASDAKKTASKAISGAGKAAGRAAKTVGDFASTSFSSAKKAVGSGANRAGDFISGLFGKKKPKKASEPTQSSNNESIIKDEDYNKRHPKQRHHLNMNYKYR